MAAASELVFAAADLSAATLANPDLYSRVRSCTLRVAVTHEGLLVRPIADQIKLAIRQRIIEQFPSLTVRPNGTLHRGELSAQASADGQTVTVTPYIKMENSNNWDEVRTLEIVQALREDLYNGAFVVTLAALDQAGAEIAVPTTPVLLTYPADPIENGMLRHVFGLGWDH